MPGTGKIRLVELSALHLRGEDARAFEARAAQIRLEQPCLVEDGTVEPSSDEL
jgi:hypothetical protein